MSHKLVLLVVLAVIAAAVAVPVDKEQTPVVGGQDADKTNVEVHDEDKTAVTDDKDSSSESDEIANRQFVYPVYPVYPGQVVVQPGLVPVQPIVPVRPVVPIQPGYVPVQPVVPVLPGYVPVQPGYPTYIRPGYAHSSVWVQRN